MKPSVKTIARIQAGIKQFLGVTFYPMSPNHNHAFTGILSEALRPHVQLNHNPVVQNPAASFTDVAHQEHLFVSLPCTHHSLAGPRAPRKTLAEIVLDDLRAKGLIRG